MCSSPAAAAQAPAFSRPIQRKPIQVSSATSRFVVSIISMYFWIEPLMSSRMWTVIFLFDSDGPVSCTSFRLNVSPPSSRKKTRNATIAAWIMAPSAPIELSQRKLPSLNLGGSRIT